MLNVHDCTIYTSPFTCKCRRATVHVHGVVITRPRCERKNQRATIACPRQKNERTSIFFERTSIFLNARRYFLRKIMAPMRSNLSTSKREHAFRCTPRLHVHDAKRSHVAGYM